MRITFIAPPFAGHFNPLLILAKAARAVGHEIDFITGPRKFPMLEANGIRPTPLRSVGFQTLEAIANTHNAVRSNPLKLLKQLEQNLQLLPSVRDELVQLWKANPPDMVVADSVAIVLGPICESLQLPWISTCASPATIDIWRGTPSYLGGWSPWPGPIGTMRDAIGRAAVHTFKRAIAAMFRKEFAALGIDRVYRRDGSEVIYSPQALLGIGIQELEFDRDWPAAFQMMGPLSLAPEQPRANILPQSRPRVLVSHGTHLLWVKKALVEGVVALSRKLPHVEFVVSLGEPERAGEPGQQRAPRVTMHPFVSYGKSLAEFDAMIHHAGTGVVYAAIQAGLPSLVIPRDYDQFDYAARVVHHKLGLRVKSLPDAAGELERILDRKQWPALERFQQYANAYQPERIFLDAVKRVSHSL
jgi:UDP:flavonoid glycosyltransferase YjiC (YdhE family)